MSAPFTDLATLTEHLRTLVAAGSPITLDDTILVPDTAAAIAEAFALPPAAPLTVHEVAPTDIPVEPGEELTIATGSASLLGLTNRPVTLAFTAAPGGLDVTICALMPVGWTFADSFPELTCFPFPQLSFTGARFVYASTAHTGYSWPSDLPTGPVTSTGITLAAGLNFLSGVGFAGIDLVTQVLGGLLAGPSLPCFGPLQPTAGQSLPVGTLTVDLTTDPTGSTVAIGVAPAVLTVANPRLVIQIGTADDLRPFQDVDLLLLGTILDAVEVEVSLPDADGRIGLSTTPLPSASSIAGLVQQLPGGAGFTQYLPAELATMFSEIGLDNFTILVDLAVPQVNYLGLSLSTEHPWTVIEGLLTLTDLRLVLEVLEPAGLALTMVSLDARAEFLPAIFPGQFDIVVELTRQTSWEVGAVSGGYFGTVTLGDLVAGLLGSHATVPSTLRNLTFRDFGITARRAAPGEPFTYTGYGAASAVFPLLDRQLVAELTVTFQHSAGGYTIALGGSVVVADQLFRLHLDLGSAGARLEANWSSPTSPLQLGELTAALGWTETPATPAGFDLALTGAGFSFDFTKGSLVLTAQSQTYGSAVLVSTLLGQQQ